MEWDLGLAGIGLLAVMALVFGGSAQLVVFALRQTTTRWLWAIATATYFVAGILISEVWYGWATAAELQPNVDGLSFDEVLLLALVPGIAVVLLTQFLASNRRQHRQPMET